MKKFTFIFTFLFLLLIPINVSASPKSYNIERLNINAEIKENGDLYVDEIFTYKFNGDFNGVYVDLNLKGSNGYDIYEVNVIDSKGEIILERKDDESNNSFQVLDSNDKIQIKIYSKSSNEEKKFKIRFTTKNTAEKYQDYSSLYWSFYTASEDYPVNNVTLNLKLSNDKFNKDDLYYTIFGDGNFNTETTENNIILTGENLTSDLGIKLRFQKDYLNIAPLESYYNEVTFEDEDFNPIYLLYPIGLITIISLIFFIVHKRNKKLFNIALQEYRSQYIFTNEEILLFPPSKESPTIVAYIYNRNNISWSIVPSTLLYLANIGVYKLNTTLDENSDFENMTFTRLKDIDAYDYPHLKILINWFKRYENDNKEFNLLSIKKLVEKSSKKAKKFDNSYWDFINQIGIDGRNLNLFTTIRNKEVLNNETYDKFLKWQAYKNHLLSLLNHKDIFNIKESIIYSAALGINYEDFDIDLKDNSINQNDYCYYYFNNMFLFNQIHSSTEKTINNSNNSSYNDFSSGSSFTGGGGGGSGAF
ncbi:MAG: DUF2207 domain-containing protein [Clostridium sp.]|uniref:DUF2207 domain-containing protein n=1 Tax=Clostridium sp. TaxID=1506 RepID=UPI0025BF96F0|nr:DUF2207 domain-containing protein [Clostridium sp.]MCF0149530.1 DUF2207 domain-containing protein [Clostridium sp.]